MSNKKSKSLHGKRKSISAPLSTDLKEDYEFRSISVREGDKVELTRGDFKGMEGEITEIDTKNQKITIEGVETATADETEVSTPVDPSNVVITSLETGDEMREKVIERKAGKEIEWEEIEEEEEEPEKPEEAEKEEEIEKEVKEEIEEIEEEIKKEEKEELKEILEQSIPDIKETIAEKEVDYELLLEVEKENKNRKTLKQWIEKKIEE